MQHREKVIFLDRLDYFTLAISIFCKLFFKKIYYRDVIKNLRSDFVGKQLIFFNILKLDYLSVSGGLYAKSFDLKYDLENKVLATYFYKNSLYKKIVVENNLTKAGANKLNSAIKYTFFTDFLSTGVSSIPLVEEKLLKHNIDVYYFVCKPSDYLLLSVYKDDKLHLISIHFMLLNIYSVFKNIFPKILLFMKKIYSKVKHKPGAVKKVREVAVQKIPSVHKDYEIGYFPHHGLSYGKFYRKTYIYESEKNSVFFKEKILTMFWGSTDSLSKRFMSINKIPNLNVDFLADRKRHYREVFNCLILLLGKKSLRNMTSYGNVITSMFLCHFLLLMHRDKNILSKTASLKVIYIHNDALFPQSFVFCCHLLGVKTVSVQERTIQYCFFGNLCYSHYIMSGEGFKDRLQKRGYVFDRYTAIGLPRSDYINEAIHRKSKYLKYINIKNNKKLILCFGLLASDDYRVGINGEDGTSISSNILFLEAVYLLAKEFPDCYFLVRYKLEHTEFFHMLPDKLISNVRDLKNIEIMEDLHTTSSYVFASLADIIIGKLTSIMEEALSCGKKVIYYDTEDYIKSLDYVLDELGVIACCYDELRNKVIEFLNEEKSASDKYTGTVDHYFSSNNKLNKFKCIKDVILKEYKSHENNIISCG